MLFELKDDKVLEIKLDLRDGYYEGSTCDTCVGTWWGPEIEIDIAFNSQKNFKYHKEDLNTTQANDRSICKLIDYLFTNINKFKDMTRDEFVENLTNHLNEVYHIKE